MKLRLYLLACLFLGVSHVALAASEAERTAAQKRSESAAEDAVMGDVLLQAMSLMGIAYRFGGTSPNTGFDCSGFIRYIFQRSIGVNLPRTAAEQAKVGRSVDRSELKPGDILFFNTRGFANSHNGLYLGNGRFVHAPRTGKNIEISNLRSSYWSSRYNGARRVTRSTMYAGDLRDEAVRSSKERKVVAAAQSEVAASSRRSLKEEVRSGGEASTVGAVIEAPSAATFAAGALASGAAMALLGDAPKRLKDREKERAEVQKALENKKLDTVKTSSSEDERRPFRLKSQTEKKLVKSNKRRRSSKSSRSSQTKKAQ